MELTTKGVIGLVAGTLGTMIVTGVATWLATTSSAGMDAAEKARIKTVLEEQLKLADGRSYGQVILSLDKNVAVIASNMELLRRAAEANATEAEDR